MCGQFPRWPGKQNPNRARRPHVVAASTALALVCIGHGDKGNAIANEVGGRVFQFTDNHTVDIASDKGSWHGMLAEGSVKWSGVDKSATFAVLTSLVREEESSAIKDLVRSVEFDDDPDTVDNMATYEFALYSLRTPGTKPDADPSVLESRRDVRDKLSKITSPIINERIMPFVNKRFPQCGSGCTVCHSMVRRYLDGERRTHKTHFDLQALVTVVVGLNSHGIDYDGGMMVSTGTGKDWYLAMQEGDTLVHQSDLLHGVHVKQGNRWSWIMWISDNPKCSPSQSTWQAEEAESGDAVAQMVKALRASTIKDKVKWLKTSAKNGFSRAQNELGMAYKEGSGVKQDLEEAAQWFRLAAPLETSAVYNLGLLELGAGNISGAASLFKECAELRDPLCMQNLAVAYQKGTEATPRSLDEAAKWFERAADFEALCMYHTAVLYSKPTETRPADQQMTTTWLDRSARAGHGQAQQQLAMRLLKAGDGVRAAYWFRRLGDEKGLLEAAGLYLQKDGWDPEKAAKILRQAADRGSARARELLAELEVSAPKSEL